MEHQEYQELLAAHALDALKASEARALTEHLDSCAQCRAELDEMRDTAALLAHASTPAAPGDEVRERILKTVHAESRDRQRVSERAGQVVPLRPLLIQVKGRMSIGVVTLLGFTVTLRIYR